MIRLVVAAALSSALALGGTASASTPRSPLVLADIAGDANGLNDGGEFTTGGIATPTSQPALDLRAVTLAPIREGDRTTGFTVVFQMQAPVSDRTQVTVTGRMPECPDLLIRYAHGASGKGLLSTSCSDALTPVRAVVRGTTVTLTVPFSALPERARQGRHMTRVNAYSQVHLLSAPALQPIGTSMLDTTTQGATYQFR